VYVKNAGVNAFPLVAACSGCPGSNQTKKCRSAGWGDDGQLNLRGHAEVPGGVNAIA